MAMVSMALTAQQSENLMNLGEPDDNGGPKYPWGLSLCVDSEALEKLGLAQLPEVGSKLVLTAIVQVTGVRADLNQDAVERGLDLQITDMQLDTGRSDEQRATSLYG